MGIRNESFMKLAAVGTWMGDFVTAWMVRNFNFTHFKRQIEDTFIISDKHHFDSLEQKSYLPDECNKCMSMDTSRDYMQYLFTSRKKNNAIIILMLAVHWDIFIYNIHTYAQTYTH